MTKRNHWLTLSAAILFGLISWGSTLQAQQAPPPSTPQTQQPPDSQAPAPQQTAPSQTPDQSQATGQNVATTEFIGTVTKQGDKYVLQDAGSGQTYDIDHQDEVKKFEGKKVRVKGTLDPATKTIHVQ
jgi:cytoskeletal protein RodZ